MSIAFKESRISHTPPEIDSGGIPAQPRASEWRVQVDHQRQFAQRIGRVEPSCGCGSGQPKRSKRASGRERCLRFLKPGSVQFQRLFPKIQQRVDHGLLSHRDAEGEAYQMFGAAVRTARAQTSAEAAMVRSEDFHHAVLVYFHERKLANRYRPNLSASPAAYIRGVASNLIRTERKKNQRRGVPVALDAGSLRDPAASDPFEAASANEIVDLVIRMFPSLTDAGLEALLAKFAPSQDFSEYSKAERKLHYARRRRALNKLGRMLRDRGIVGL